MLVRQTPQQLCLVSIALLIVSVGGFSSLHFSGVQTATRTPLSSTATDSAAETVSMEPTTTTVQTLAGPFVIGCSTAGSVSTYEWSLKPIDDEHPSRAWQALHKVVEPTHDDKNNNSLTIQVAVETESNTLRVSWIGRKQEDGDTKQEELFSILEAVAVQWAAAKVSSSPLKKWQVVDDGSNPLASFQRDENPSKLFAKQLETLGSPEWVEMVDQTGQPLGRVPRPLVHTHNLLHRGIGLFVTKDRSIFLHPEQSEPNLYVHQRTATKRIFPSLYDMFVGGVAGAGESSLLTAQREVAEELGLRQALHLSKEPLLTCVVCTSYNRCVVDLYEYVMDTAQEEVSWQAEEVAWGSFCSYALVEAAADRSLQRLETKQQWPGQTPVVQSPRKGELTEGKVDEAWKEWDFVPDGLLVWEAWLQWRAEQVMDVN